jgi:hypothetical protein
MKTDRLEQFMRENRDAFNDADPDPLIWDRIEKRPAPIRTLRWQTVAWRAAAVVIIFSASWFLHDVVDRNDSQNVTREQAGLIEEQSPLVRELFEAEVYYSSQIEFKKEEIFRLVDNNTDIVNEIDGEFIELDKIYDDLKKDLSDNAANEEVIEAMIMNYRIKLDILEEMLHAIQESETENNDNHEDKVFAI